ncbi:hypothetical protein U1Q18_003815 [Sarracenia purpurea var. burkii]
MGAGPLPWVYCKGPLTWVLLLLWLCAARLLWFAARVCCYSWSVAARACCFVLGWWLAASVMVGCWFSPGFGCGSVVLFGGTTRIWVGCWALVCCLARILLIHANDTMSMLHANALLCAACCYVPGFASFYGLARGRGLFDNYMPMELLGLVCLVMELIGCSWNYWAWSAWFLAIVTAGL